MPGLAQGLAEGLQSGLSLGSTLQMRKFEQGLQEREATRADQTAQRQQAATALEAIKGQREDLRNRLMAHLATPEDQRDPAEATQLAQENDLLTKAQKVAYQHAGGADVTSAVQSAQQDMTDLANGTKRLSDIPDDQYYQHVSLLKGSPAGDHIDTPNSVSAATQGVQQLHSGMQSANIPDIIGGFNALTKPSLVGHLIGQTGYDGGTVTDANIIGAVPHPNDPNQVSLAVQLQHDHPLNGTGQQVVPLLDDHGHTLRHPDDTGHVNVPHFNMQNLADHAGSAATFQNAINQPESAQKIINAENNGARPSAEKLLQIYRGLGGKGPEDWAPDQSLLVNSEGKVVGVVPGKGKVVQLSHEYAAEQAQARLLTALAALSRADRAPQQNLVPWQVQGSNGPESVLLDTHSGQIIKPNLPQGLSGPLTRAGSPTAGQLLAPEALEDAARTWITTGTPPSGFGRSPATLAAIANHKAEIERANGDDASAAASQQVANKASQSALSDITKRNTQLEANANAAERNFQTVEKLATKVDRTGSPLINRLVNAWNTDVIQDPDLAALKNAVSEAATEYGKIVAGQTTGAGVTDATNRQVQRLLSVSDNPQAFAAELSTMREFIANRRAGFQQERQGLLSQMGGGNKAPAAGGVVKVSSPADAAKLPIGTHFQTPDGRILERH